MVCRYVFFRFQEAYRSDAHMTEILHRTHALLAEVPGVISYEVGTPADEQAMDAWDMSIMISFADMPSVRAYIVDPMHRAYVDDFIKPRLEVLKAWNFSPNEVASSIEGARG